VIDRAVALCERRAAGFDLAHAVLVHGDAHGWNTLEAGAGTYKFVDPEGLRSEPAHDLSVPMREYNAPLLAGDTPRLVRERAARLASLCDVDPEAVWEWGFIERVSTGLANLGELEDGEGNLFLEVAERCL
jgi:streptomycin 6-kinase